MCSVAASVVSRQYMHHSPSRFSHRPTCRNPSSRTSIGIRSVSAGNRGSVARACVIHILAAHGQPAQRRHRRERRETAASQVGAFTAPDVLDCLRTAQRRKAGVSGDGALAHQHAQARDCADVTHGLVVAQLVLTSEKPEVRKVDESRETGRRQRRDVPEEAEAKEPIEPAQRREASVRERTIEQQMVRLGVRAHQRVFDGTAVPGFEDRELMQQRQRRIGHAASGLETPERALAGEGGDDAVARVRAQQIHALQLLAELQVGHASVGDRALPAHL